MDEVGAYNQAGWKAFADMFPDQNAEPGSWDHFIDFAPPWIKFLAKKEV
jgi:hypothetical protein